MAGQHQMVQTQRLRFIAAMTISLFQIPFSLGAKPLPLSELTAGDLPHLVSILGPETYFPHSMQKLAHPTLIWADLEWFREKHFLIPKKEGIDKFKKELLDLLGYTSQLSNEPNSAFLNQFQTWFADRYGGSGCGCSGSGRAAAKGIVQIKGAGQTGLLLFDAEDPSHSDGAVYLSEGLYETIASQILARVLPYGANRVIALIATGTFIEIHYKDQVILEPRVLIVREDPLRPAHMMFNMDTPDQQIEKHRIKKIMKKILDILPTPSFSSKKTKGQQLKDGILYFVEKVAETQSFMFAHSLYNGAISPSNIEMSAAALDFGRFTSFWGYPKAYTLDEAKPFGDNEDFTDVLTEFSKTVSRQIPHNLRSYIPSPEEILKHFKEKYETSLFQQMTLLTGVPPELLSTLEEKESIQSLGKVLCEIAIEGNSAWIDATEVVPKKTGKYDLPQILKTLARIATEGQLESREFIYDKAVQPLVPKTVTRKKLVKSYHAVLTAIHKEAEKHDVSVSALHQYIALAEKIHNLKIPDLMQDISFTNKYKLMIEEFGKTWDPGQLWSSIDRSVYGNPLFYRNSIPYKLILSEEKDSENLLVKRNIFDLKLGQTKTTFLRLSQDSFQIEPCDILLF